MNTTTAADSNNMTQSATFTEQCALQFAAYGRHMQSIDDVNDLQAIDRAIQAALQRPAPNCAARHTQPL